VECQASRTVVSNQSTTSVTSSSESAVNSPCVHERRSVPRVGGMAAGAPELHG
jgi:hypothetical protein